jgi:ADP-ribose pyrophosphatase YjhB (NUDIX family)
MRNDFSAGGVVTDAAGRVALIRRTGPDGEPVWGLPKGHLKNGETAPLAAVRETQEETGLLVQAHAGGPAGSIEYSFVSEDGERIYKRVDFYRMEAVGGDPARHDDEVDEVALLTVAEAVERLTFANERRLLDDILG